MLYRPIQVDQVFHLELVRTYMTGLRKARESLNAVASACVQLALRASDDRRDVRSLPVYRLYVKAAPPSFISY